MSRSEATFYTISDAGYFLGTVGLLNSLRLCGQSGELVVLDRGFTEYQRTLLQQHCRLVSLSGTATNPTLFKPFATKVGATGTIVIIDSDMVVTDPLQNITQEAAAGRICVFPDPEADRWFGEWQQLFGLDRPPRRQTYVNAGFVALSADHHRALLQRWWKCCEQIWSHPTQQEGMRNGPTVQADQDALNALLMTDLPSDAVALQPVEQAPAADALRSGVRVQDVHRLRCIYRGRPTVLLHCAGKGKPWQESRWFRTHRTAYVRLLRRLLSSPDVALQLPAKDLPLWLRPGPVGAAALIAVGGISRAAFPVIRLLYAASGWLSVARPRRTSSGRPSHAQSATSPH